MKDKILMLIIGILIGAIIASGCFLIFGKNNNNFGGDRRGFDANMIGGGKMERPLDRYDNSMGEPPTNPEDSTEGTSADA